MRPYYEDTASGITIYHGDSFELADAIQLPLACEVTDPPYGISYRQPRKERGRMSVRGDSSWNFDPPALPFVVWGANNGFGYHGCGWLVWDKKRYGGDLYGDGELAAISEVRGVRIFPCRWDRNHGDGWTGQHPTEKPLSLMEWCLGFMPPGRVLDRFAGSGTTLLAAKALKRPAIGIEIEERYCEIAARRLDQLVLPLGGT